MSPDLGPAGAAATIIAAYLLGGVSPSYLLVRRRLGRDVRTLGSGNAGATNVLRLLGPFSGLAILLLDATKGAAAVWGARALGASVPIVALAALAAVVGHVFPIYHGLRGGKGVATAAGALGSLQPWAAGIAALVFLTVVLTTRFVALGSILGVASFPLLTLLVGPLGLAPPPSPWLIAASAVTAALIVGKHRINLTRIRTGDEWRLGDPRGPGQEVS